MFNSTYTYFVDNLRRISETISNYKFITITIEKVRSLFGYQTIKTPSTPIPVAPIVTNTEPTVSANSIGIPGNFFKLKSVVPSDVGCFNKTSSYATSPYKRVFAEPIETQDINIIPSPFIDYNPYIVRNTRLRAMGDPIRGDLPIVPASGTIGNELHKGIHATERLISKL